MEISYQKDTLAAQGDVVLQKPEDALDNRRDRKKG